jgi:mRNA-degrading endonuclease RelE of RelBE toxin-antitoxin system
MNGAFRVVTTPAFEREFSKLSRGNNKLLDAFQDLIAVLSEDPHGRTGRHPIKKLAGLNPGEGQWRIRWRAYRLRYDIFGREVVLHSPRHRKEAY